MSREVPITDGEEIKAPEAGSGATVLKVMQETSRKATEIEPETERVDLKIDWDSLDRGALFSALSRYDELSEARPGVDSGEIQIFKGTLLAADGEEVVFDVTKWPQSYKGSADELQISIIRPGESERDKKYVADFDFARYPEEGTERWDMKHRRTGAVYQGQGIANEILSVAEEFLRQRAQQKGNEQYISCNPGQKSIIKWLEKRGYQAADSEKLKRIESEPEGIQEFSAPNDDRNGNERPKAWLFDVQEFARRFPGIEGGPANPMVWDGKNYHEPFFYMNSGFSVALSKKIT